MSQTRRQKFARTFPKSSHERVYFWYFRILGGSLGVCLCGGSKKRNKATQNFSPLATVAKVYGLGHRGMYDVLGGKGPSGRHLVAPYCAIPRDYLSDTPLLRAMGFLVSQHGQWGAIPPPPFLSVSPLESMRSGGAIPPPQKGYLSDTCTILVA